MDDEVRRRVGLGWMEALSGGLVLLPWSLDVACARATEAGIRWFKVYFSAQRIQAQSLSIVFLGVCCVMC